MDFLSSLVQNVSVFFSADPSVLLVQSLTIGATCIIVFLVLYATRDILLRTQSFLLQIFCILLVAALPVVGFLLYLLIRPTRTTSERRLEQKLDKLLQMMQKKGQEKKK